MAEENRLKYLKKFRTNTKNIETQRNVNWINQVVWNFYFVLIN